MNDHLTINCPLCRGSGKIVTDRAIGAAMRTLRKQASISLQKMSPHMGLSVSYLSHLETGRRRWNDELRARYLDAVKSPL